LPDFYSPALLNNCPARIKSRLALDTVECQHQTNFRFLALEGFDMKFIPLHDRVLVRRVEEEDKTAGGIIIPDTAQEKPMQGEILAVGSGARNDKGEITPLDVKVGDNVLFGKWSGTEIKVDDEELLIMKESDIMGVIA
jgi:chaperonin GroES